MALFLVCIVGMTGCSRVVLKEKTIQAEEWTCDEAADQALRRQDYKRCILLHERFLLKEPSNGLALYHLGYAFGQTGNHEKEISYYEKAIALGFNRHGIFFNLGMAYGEMNRIKESIGTFKLAIEKDPENSDNHFGLALAYQRNSSYRLAEMEFLKAIEIEPKNVDARLHLGIFYIESGQKQKAGEQLRKTLKIDPDNEAARHLLENIR